MLSALVVQLRSLVVTHLLILRPVLVRVAVRHLVVRRGPGVQAELVRRLILTVELVVLLAVVAGRLALKGQAGLVLLRVGLEATARMLVALLLSQAHQIRARLTP